MAIVQGGGPQRTRAANTEPGVVFERHLEASQLVQKPVDLVVWPEDVVDVHGLFVNSEERLRLAELATQLDATLVAGVVEDVSATQAANFAAVFTPDGSLVDRYDKVRLVPFGEYVPMRSLIEPLAPDYLPARDMRRGDSPAVVDTPVGRLGLSISWEIFFEDRARDAIGNGGEVLLNPTNGASYWLTIVQTQQIASSQLRAMETGRWVVQSAPTGFSAFIDPDGNVYQRTAVSERKVIQTEVELRTGHTLATRAGPWPMVALSLAALASRLGRLTTAPPPHPAAIPVDQISTIRVTGPSLVSSTAIMAPNEPVATVAPRVRSSATRSSIRAAAWSGAAAPKNEGRRPRLMSP